MVFGGCITLAAPLLALFMLRDLAVMILTPVKIDVGGRVRVQ